MINVSIRKKLRACNHFKKEHSQTIANGARNYFPWPTLYDNAAKNHLNLLGRVGRAAPFCSRFAPENCGGGTHAGAPYLLLSATHCSETAPASWEGWAKCAARVRFILRLRRRSVELFILNNFSVFKSSVVWPVSYCQCFVWIKFRQEFSWTHFLEIKELTDLPFFYQWADKDK